LPGADRFGADPIQLLHAPAVQKELAITDDQKKKLTALSADVHKEAEALAKQKEGGKAGAADFEAFITATRDKVSKILNAKQIERFKEIQLQLYGAAAAVHDKEVAEKLGVSKQQGEKLRGIAEKGDEKMRGAFERPRSSDPAEIAKVLKANSTKIEDIFQERSGELASALTDEQKATLEKMRGKPFKFDRSDVAAPPPAR
jgi:hypothetical protein